MEGKTKENKSIPVGCIPIAAVTTTRCQYRGGLSSGVEVQGRYPTSPVVNRQTLLKTLPPLAVSNKSFTFHDRFRQLCEIFFAAFRQKRCQFSLMFTMTLYEGTIENSITFTFAFSCCDIAFKRHCIISRKYSFEYIHWNLTMLRIDYELLPSPFNAGFIIDICCIPLVCALQMQTEWRVYKYLHFVDMFWKSWLPVFSFSIKC